MSNPAISVVVIKENSSDRNGHYELKQLLDPSTGLKGTYMYREGSFYELQTVDSYPSSWFINNTVIEDGSFVMASRIHPLFYCLPILKEKTAYNYMSLEDIFMISDCPDMNELKNNDSVKKSIQLVCAVKDIGEDKYYKYDPDLCMKWLRNRIELAEKGLRETQIVKAKKEIDDIQIKHEAFRLICKYLSSTMQRELLQFLQMTEKELIPSAREKRIWDTIKEVEVVEAKTHSSSKNEKQSPSKKVKTITSFFTRK